jgi:hypothetical protein
MNSLDQSLYSASCNSLLCVLYHLVQSLIESLRVLAYDSMARVCPLLKLCLGHMLMKPERIGRVNEVVLISRQDPYFRDALSNLSQLRRCTMVGGTCGHL